MLLVLQIIFLALLVGILVYTALFYFASSRTFKVTTLLIVLIISVPLLALSIYVFASRSFDYQIKMWALGVAALILAFWFKSPLANVKQG